MAPSPRRTISKPPARWSRDQNRKWKSEAVELKRQPAVAEQNAREAESAWEHSGAIRKVEIGRLEDVVSK